MVFAFVMMTSFAWPVEERYEHGKLVSVEQKTREKVDMYLVNTPVTTAVPYFEVTVRLAANEYVAEYTPRREEEKLPADWSPAASVEARVDKRFLFLKRPDGTEMKWLITKHTRVKKEKE